MPQDKLTQALLNRYPRDPKLHNDRAGDGHKALQQDDFLISKILEMYTQPTDLLNGETLPPADPPSQDEIQQTFDGMRQPQNPIPNSFTWLGKRWREQTPTNWELQHIQEPVTTPVKKQ